MSSAEQDKINLITERIARRLSANTTEQHAERAAKQVSANGEDDLTALRNGLAEIQQRLAHIESHITHDEKCDHTNRVNPSYRHRENEQELYSERNSSSATATVTRSPWLSGTYVPATHPSDERFGIGEAVTELVDYFEREKKCAIEPGEKPCDHCGMCSSRGF